jgi:hypothetical protein
MNKMIMVIALVLSAIMPVTSVFAATPSQQIVIGVSKIVAHPALDAVEKGIQDQLAAAKINATFDLQNANGDIGTAASIANFPVAGQHPERNPDRLLGGNRSGKSRSGTVTERRHQTGHRRIRYDPGETAD